MSENKYVEQIKKLLAKANDTSCTEQEAAAFNAKAHELMLKYNVDRATIEAVKAAIRKHMTLEVQLRPWSQAILGGITKLYYCTYFSTTKGRAHTITIIGEEQNLAMCHAICVMVLRSVVQAARLNGGGRSFMTGAGYEVSRRCAEMYAHAHGALPSNASGAQALLSSSDRNALVVLADSEKKSNHDYIEFTLNIKGLRPRQSKGPKVRDASAFAQGVAHGNTVQLRRNLLR